MACHWIQLWRYLGFLAMHEYIIYDLWLISAMGWCSVSWRLSWVRIEYSSDLLCMMYLSEHQYSDVYRATSTDSSFRYWNIASGTMMSTYTCSWSLRTKRIDVLQEASTVMYCLPWSHMHYIHHRLCNMWDMYYLVKVILIHKWLYLKTSDNNIIND